MGIAKTDCVFIQIKHRECRALRKLYCSACEDGKCNFYKSTRDYNEDGTKKDNKWELVSASENFDVRR